MATLLIQFAAFKGKTLRLDAADSLADGVRQDHIIEIALDEPSNYKYHNPLKLEKHLKLQIKDNGDYYVFIDEVQFVKRIKVRDSELKEKRRFQK